MGLPEVLPVSVVVPCHNHARFLGQCIASIAAGPAIREVVLVDNASTDGSAELAEAIGPTNLRVIRNATNLGATRARDLGVRAAASDHVAFVDSDDFLGPDAIGRAWNALVANDLDYSLFTLWRVGLDGSGARLETPAPERPLTGPQAFARTLGRWDIFSMGVLEKQLYLAALARFGHHGYSDDELLIRHTFLSARRVGGSDGAYFYRAVDKPYTWERVLGQVRTNLAALELAWAERAAVPEDAIRAQRDRVARDLLGLAVRARGDAAKRAEARGLAARFARVPVRWRLRDARPFAMRAAWPVLLGRTA